jgi:plastocyanin
MRKLLLTLSLTVLAACAGPTTSQPPTNSQAPTTNQAPTNSPPQTAAASDLTIPVTLRDFEIEPETVASAGTVTFAVTSEGPTPHNFTIRDSNDEVVARSEDLGTGESDTVGATLTPGEYTFFCAFAGHESLGMHGALTITQ